MFIIGTGRHPRLRAANITEKRQAANISGGLRNGERHAEDGIGAEARFVWRSVEGDHRLVDGDLILGIHAGERIENIAVDGFDRLQDALAAEASLIAVAQFDSFVCPGRGARRNRRTPERPVLQGDVNFDRRIAAAIQNFAASNIDNGGHAGSCYHGDRKGSAFTPKRGGKEAA